MEKKENKAIKKARQAVNKTAKMVVKAGKDAAKASKAKTAAEKPRKLTKKQLALREATFDKILAEAKAIQKESGLNVIEFAEVFTEVLLLIYEGIGHAQGVKSPREFAKFLMIQAASDSK